MSPYAGVAKAELIDPTGSNLTTVLVFSAIVLAAGVLAFVPILLAWSRRHRRSDAIIAAALLWALIAAISAGTTTLAQMKYSHEHQLLIQSGYYDPNDTRDAPAVPALLWAGLAGGYGAMIAWPLLTRPTSQPRQ